MTVRCLVFDVDDTLYLERDFVRSGFSAVGSWVEQERSRSGFGERCWQLFVDGVRGSTFDRALTDLGLRADRTTVQTLVEVYRSHTPDIALLPDVATFLTKHTDIPMAAITDGPEAGQRAKVQALQLHRWMDPIVLTEELGAHARKPSPIAFERVQAALGHEADACCYIGDNPAKDFAAPRALGWRTVRVRRCGGLHHGVPSGADVDHEIDSLSDLASVLWSDAPRS